MVVPTHQRKDQGVQRRIRLYLLLLFVIMSKIVFFQRIINETGRLYPHCE